MKLTLLFMLVLLSQQLFAKSIYLECNLMVGSKEYLYDIKLDEASENRTLEHKNVGSIDRGKAFFTPENISFKTNGGPGVIVTWSIDRQTLKFTRSMNFTSLDRMSESEGDCSLLEMKKNKI